MWYISTIEYYLAIKNNEIMLSTGKWMELEIILSEISQASKIQILHFTHLWNLDLK
jgi:hypothetical protein